MNFWETSKGGAGVIINPKIYIADFGALYRAFFGQFPKKIAIIFRNYGGRGGQRPFGIFNSRNIYVKENDECANEK